MRMIGAIVYIDNILNDLVYLGPWLEADYSTRRARPFILKFFDEGTTGSYEYRCGAEMHGGADEPDLVVMAFDDRFDYESFEDAVRGARASAAEYLDDDPY